MLTTYREFPARPDLRHAVACLWENEPAEDEDVLIVPDGCVDLIWQAGRDLIVAGADTGPRVAPLPGSTLSSGIRLRPGAARAILGVDASELRDRQVDAQLVWGEPATQLAEALGGAEPATRLRLLEEAVASRRGEPDEVVLAAAPYLAAAEIPVRAGAAAPGLSARQLNPP